MVWHSRKGGMEDVDLTTGQVPEKPAVESEDVAWATVRTPLGKDKLRDFCRDIERLYRINPMLEIREWHSLGAGRYHVVGRNLSQKKPFDFEFDIEVGEQSDDIQIRYLEGIKLRTTFRVESAPTGSSLSIIDEYRDLPAESTDEQLATVDKSLVAWANYLREYIVMWKRWSWFAPWRWYMRRVWQPMNPSARRITYMILWITFAEILAFLMIFFIFWLELDSFLGDDSGEY